ncbi:MAG: GGDEF domain-containing protein [Planctomycetaceae bacterium TMED241]|uniref:sensor domain-containing diguanylate cyclase n=1 Tax=unclassified Afipia TaxID=2642050 RepID=UPI0004667E56|nr:MULTISPECIES: sensor domain-containing diguanylate cyclase [unclassified Afipia]RPG09039.1 MAG: GGDEF domain-containing protein [Planctomycetaceae bacterium TMED241]HAP11532.1 GGDEF domain-containing protein [Afipia sp.]HBR46225.1 GGDEF domain-containing protein [Afipia sp.]HCX16116.1 GGDEF domain-containing protein [Afipia sp.]
MRLRLPMGQPGRSSAKLLVWCSIATIVGFSAVCGSMMLDMRRSEQALALRSMENLATTIDSDISRNIELYDLSLRNVANNMIEPELASVSKRLLNLILFDHAATAKHFGAIQVFDAAGNLLHDSATDDPKPENRSDENYFSVHRDNPNAGLLISRPGLHRGAYAIVLSRRITGRDGAFLGVVVGSLRFSYFHDLFERLSLAAEDVISVVRRDGVVIMRTPFDLDVIGRDLSQSPGVKRVLEEQSGTFEGAGAIDPIQRLYVWRDSSHPLVVIVGKSWTDIFAIWRSQALRVGVIMLALIAFVAGATMMLAREIKRRGRAEDKLAELAITDALTGLRNRRRFDQVIEQEWLRARRRQEPLALLMIDADHFKTYNDMFGHQAGDQVLVRIATSIAGAVERARDCAARYGGEEFAVLLPGLSADMALVIGENIRTRVEMLSADKWATTVSVGVASVVPNEAMQPAHLIEAADKALYEAKSRGRNQSVVTPRVHLSRVA